MQAIYDHVKFERNGLEYAIQDESEFYWDTNGKKVIYHPSEEVVKQLHDDKYECNVAPHYLYKQSIYPGEALTLIFTDPNVHKAKFFSLFLNAKRVRALPDSLQ